MNGYSTVYNDQHVTCRICALTVNNRHTTLVVPNIYMIILLADMCAFFFPNTVYVDLNLPVWRFPTFWSQHLLVDQRDH